MKRCGMEGDSYTRMGPRFRQKAGDAYTTIWCAIIR